MSNLAKEAAGEIVNQGGTSLAPPAVDSAGRGPRPRGRFLLRPSARVAAAVLLLILPLIYFSPAVKGEVVLMLGDGWVYSFFMRLLLGSMLAQGVPPFWNPYSFSGMPLLAAVQPGVLYPPNWIFAFLPAGVAMNVVVITTYHVALVGTYLYARAIKLGRLAALGTAVVFTFGGFMIMHADQTNFVAASAWLPWPLYAIEKIYCRASGPGGGPEARPGTWGSLWAWVTLGAVCVALQLFAGLPQATWLTLLLCAAYTLFSLTVRDDREWGRGGRRRFLVSVGALAVCGALLSAIQLLPSRELQQQGERAAIPYEAFATFSMPPRYLLTLIFPYFFGGGLSPLYHVAGWDQWWLRKWVCAYVGVIGLLLALVAVFSPGRRRLTWFWAGAATVALILSLGDYLPFGAYRLLYHVPIYNLFRAPYRHTFEFTFAAAVLAGVGLNLLKEVGWKSLRPALVLSFAVLAALAAAAVMAYLFLAHRLGAESPPPDFGARLTNPGALVPLTLLAVGGGAAWFYARSKSRVAGAVLLVLLFLDIASFGWFGTWRTTGYEVVDRLGDPPPVQVIKGRETDLHSFRITSHAVWPYGENFELLNHANMSLARGLQSATGYDPMRLPRPALLAGDLSIFGDIRDHSLFGPDHRGLDLLNVRYLLRERSAPLSEGGDRIVVRGGMRFEAIEADYKLSPGARLEFDLDGVTATDLAFVSAMANSGGVPDGAVAAVIRLHTTDGRVIERELQAGRDTAEWAYDRPDVRAVVKHARAPIAEDLPGNAGASDFRAHRYLARFTFERAGIDHVEVINPLRDAALTIARATVADAETGKAYSLDRRRLSPERWRSLGSFGAVDLYENLKARPRAWFVSQIRTLAGADVVRAVREGGLPDGSRFDPAVTALLEHEDLGGGAPATPVAAPQNAECRVTRYEPHLIELATRNANSGFMVLSEVYYRGWDAFVDGVETPVYRVDHALRGIAVPPGDHRVEFRYRAPSFYRGAAVSGFGLALLTAGGLLIRLKPRFGASARRRFAAWEPGLATVSARLERLRRMPRVEGMAAAAFLILLPPAFFWRQTLGRLTLGAGDTLNQFFPAFTLAVRQLSGGQIPLWNPSSYSGMPLFADSQLGLLDPLNWVYFLGATARAMTVSQELTFVVSLLGAYAYARSLELRRRAGVVTAVIYALSGFAVARTLYPALPHVFALTPLVLYFVERLYRGRHGRSHRLLIAGGAMTVAWQILASHPQPLVYSSIVATSYALFCALLRRDEGAGAAAGALADPRRSRASFLLRYLLVYVSGVALAAVHLVPNWELVSQSVRGRLPYDTFAQNSLHPLTLLSALIPFFHGGGQGSGIYRLPYWGAYWHHNEGQLYLGVLALSLAAAGAAYAWRARHRVYLFWCAVAAAAVLLSFGHYLGPAAKLIYQVPLLGNFRSSNRLWMMVVLAAAVLAGYAVDRLTRSGGGADRLLARDARVTALLLAALCAVAGGAVLSGTARAERLFRGLTGWDFMPDGFLRQAGAEYVLPGVCALGAFVVIWVFTRPGRNRYALLLLALLADYQLYAVFAPINSSTDFQGLLGGLMPAEIAARQKETEPIRYHWLAEPGPFAFEPFWFYGHEMATGRNPLIGRRYQQLMGLDEGGFSHRRSVVEAKDWTLDLLNVRYIISPTEVFKESAAAAESGPADQAPATEYQGISFPGAASAAADLSSGRRALFAAPRGSDTLAIVSTLSNAAAVENHDEVANVTVQCGGRSLRLPLLAGRDTAEWAYDRPDVRAVIKHARAPLAASQTVKGAAGEVAAHTYLARLKLPAEMADCGSTLYVEVASVARGSVVLNLKNLALYDSATRRSTALRRRAGSSLGDISRWRQVPDIRPAHGARLWVYENTRAMPRVWVVERVKVLGAEDQLRVISGQAGVGPDSDFDPRLTSLVEPETAAKLDRRLLSPGDDRAAKPAGGAARVAARTTKSMLVEAEVARPSLLMLSETAYPGWRVEVDGRETEFLRANYLLRAVELAPGRHQIKIFYRPSSVAIGALVSVVTGCCLLLALKREHG